MLIRLLRLGGTKLRFPRTWLDSSLDFLIVGVFADLFFFLVSSVNVNISLKRLEKLVKRTMSSFKQRIKSCADSEGGREVRTPPPEKSQKYRVSLQNCSGSPVKSQSYQASIQWWATIGPPAKRHLKGVSLVGR